MKTKIISFLASFMFVLFFANQENCLASGPTYVDVSEIKTPTTWTKESSPYIIKSSLAIWEDLIIEPGVVVKMAGNINIGIGRSMSIKGTEQDKIVFTSIKDDKILGDTNEDGNDSLPAVSDWNGFTFRDSIDFEMENVQISYASLGLDIKHVVYNTKNVSIKNSLINNNLMGIRLYGSYPTIEGNFISNNNIGIFVIGADWWGGKAKAKNNSIVDNLEGIRVLSPMPTYYGGLYMDARENWWGDKSGPYFKHANYGNDNLGGAGNSVSDGVLFDPWLGKDPTIKDPGCLENCYSNVMFLPGHQASRLYRKDSDGDEDQLWEPTNHNEDVQQLYMNPNDGSSNDSNIYTRDILDEAYGINNVYKGFMASMDKIVADGVINKWQAFAYDWRKPLEDVVDNGTKLEDGSVENVLDQIRNSAKESKTGKVTLIGHSNGGLLAKVIVDSLKKSGEEKLVDRIIMVATPQIGTPKAALGLLHGDGSNFLYGVILDKKTARGFGENMISAYNLLPSKKYFDVVQSPVIEFDSDVKNIYDFPSIFGNDINNFDEFKKFLLGDDGKRTEPDTDDTDSPNVLKDNFFSQAEKTHESLDLWQAPAGMEVVQIAGWGLDTIRGIKYDDCDFIFCPNKLSNIDRSLLFTQDGDETVVVPSAVEMDGNAERYYVDLKLYNNLLDLDFKVSREHADILEIEPLQDFIKNIIQGKKESVNYISMEKPEVKNEDKSLRYRLHSPVALHIYDKDGRHTGLIENKNPLSDLRFFEKQIPNSYYMEFGETKYAGSEGNLVQTVILEGEDLGTFTFEIDEVIGKQDVKTTTFTNIPVMQGMKAEILISDSIGEMKIDVENDGQIDAIFRPGEVIKREDLLEIFEKIISSLDVDKTVKDRLVNKIDNAKKQLEKGHSVAADAMLRNVKHQIEVFSDINTPEKFRILKDEAEKLMGIMDKILAM